MNPIDLLGTFLSAEFYDFYHACASLECWVCLEPSRCDPAILLLVTMNWCTIIQQTGIQQTGRNSLFLRKLPINPRCF